MNTSHRIYARAVYLQEVWTSAFRVRGVAPHGVAPDTVSFRYDINNIISYLIGNIRCLGSLTVGVRDAADFLTGTDLANDVVSSIGNIQIPGSINCNTGGDVEPCTGGSSAIRGVAGDPICLTNYSGDVARSVNLV